MRKNMLKGVWHEIFSFRIFHESVSPGPLSMPLGPFQIFSKIHGDIRLSAVATTPAMKEKNFEVYIFLHIFVKSLLGCTLYL